MADETIWKFDIQSGSSLNALKKVEDALSNVKKSINQAVDAGENFSKLSSLQTKAAEAAEKVKVAHASAAVALKKAEDAANAGKVSAEQLALMQAKAALAAEKIKVAEDAAGNAMQKAQGEAQRLAEASQSAASKGSTLAHAFESAKSVLSNISSGVHAATGKMGELASSAAHAGGSILSSFKNAASSVLEFGSKVGMAIFGLQQIWQMAVGAGKALLGPNASLEQMRVSFKAFIPDAQQLTKTLSDLRQFAALSPFATPEVNKAALSLLNMKVQAKDLTAWLNNIGAAVSKVGGDGLVLDEVTQIIQQMGVKGKITTEEMLQLSERNIPAFQILADAMHVPTSQLQDMITKGQLGKDKIDLLVQSMGKFGGSAMLEQGQTFVGLLSTLKDNAELAWAAFTGPLFEKAKTGLETLGNLVSSDKFQNFATGAGQKVAEVFDKIGNSIQRTKPFFDQLWQVINDEPFGMFMVSLGMVGNSLGSLAGSLFDLWKAASPVGSLFKNSGSAGDTFAKILYTASVIIQDDIVPAIDNFTKFIKGITPVLAPIGKQFFATFELIGGYVKQAWPSIMSIGKQVFEGIGNVIKQVAPVISGQLMPAIQNLIKTIGPLVVQFFQWIDKSGIIKIVFMALAETIKTMVMHTTIAINIVIAIIKAFQWWQNASTQVGVFIGNLIKNIIGWFGTLPKFFSDIFGGAKTGATNAFGGIGQWFGDRWKDIQGAFAAVGTWFGDRFAEARAGITNAFGAIGQWFGDRWKEIYAPVKPVVDYILGVYLTFNNILLAVTRIAWGAVSQAIAVAAKWIQGLLIAAWGAISTGVSIAWNWVSSIISGVWGGISQGVAWAATKIWQGLTWVWDKISAGAQWAWNGISSFIKWVWGGISGFITWAATGVWNGLTWAWNKIKDGVMWAWNGISGFIKWAWDGISKIIGDKVNWLKDTILKPFNQAKDAIFGVAKGFVNGLIDGLNLGIAGIENFLNFFRGAVDKITTALHVKNEIPVAKLPRIPKYAAGTDGHPGGPAIVGEQGREMVFLPRGASVVPNNLTEMLLAMAGGGVPGYAGGIGDIAGNIMNWIGSGAKALLDNVIKALNIKAPSIPGMANVGGAIFERIKGWATGFIDRILPKFDFGGPGGGAIPGNLKEWISAAMAITKVPGSWAGALATIAMYESGGNPRAINNYDVNAKNGDPSRGLFQTIGATFRAHALPGHGDIWNPVDNAIAAIRYIIGRYGDVFHVPGIMALARGEKYVGYRKGGLITEQIAGIGLRTGTRYAFGEAGNELVMPAPGFNSPSNTISVRDDAALVFLARIADLLEKRGSATSTTLNANVMPGNINEQRINQAIQSLGGLQIEAMQRGAW